MPNQPATPQRAVRVDDETWEQLGDAAVTAGTDRSAILRQLAQWWLRRPGAKMPERPRAVPGGTKTEPSGGEPAQISPDEPGREMPS
jgi:hypothetical protein